MAAPFDFEFGVCLAHRGGGLNGWRSNHEGVRMCFQCGCDVVEHKRKRQRLLAAGVEVMLGVNQHPNMMRFPYALRQ
jgi:hypothetical protein